MKNSMMTPAEAAARIDAGAVLVIAGSEEALSHLPKGRWIGGTSVYFMTETGGRIDRENLFVTELDAAQEARPVHYQGEDLPSLTMGRYDNGLSVILLPAFSKAHEEFALHGAEYPGLFDQPVMGWVTGVHLDDLGRVTPKVFDGSRGLVFEDGAMVLHVALRADRVADIDILNLFEQDMDGQEITFSESGFKVRMAHVDGAEVDFADWVTAQGLDTRLPLVANYAGALVNASFQSVTPGEGVAFYAPVVAGTSYRIARSPGDYATIFAERAKGDGRQELSCNCILNFLYGEMESKSTGSFTGPATFGEIAYILLNQTMVRLQLHAAQAAAVA
ncbi:DUF6976 family protein [Salipiger marinus]|jgi:hypothetical protein|uniref:Uncharacterized protein n=2 Tax=Salipiger marinus TaxID=555512 RepID=A0A1G8IBJ4_9RHOB|nr:hypothetical protein [Salipiger manganoxidans]MCD1617228.1 hypothetical protein [Salipiger manganoxidans]MEB3417275.1 hypothetical protein [Salipiger manganoxidans]SDI15930.1 hypothetical protein SAMN04487993_1001331 [Salipiger marinus]